MRYMYRCFYNIFFGTMNTTTLFLLERSWTPLLKLKASRLESILVHDGDKIMAAEDRIIVLAVRAPAAFNRVRRRSFDSDLQQPSGFFSHCLP